MGLGTVSFSLLTILALSKLLERTTEMSRCFIHIKALWNHNNVTLVLEPENRGLSAVVIENLSRH